MAAVYRLLTWATCRCTTSALRHSGDLPQPPGGCFGMFRLAYIPPLWFRVMDRRLLAPPQARGDFDRVNLDPRRADALRQRFARETFA
jgi:alkane 1-monooxygenase